MDRLLDNEQNGSLNWLKHALPEGEDELIRVQTDLDEKGDFGNQWVVVTRNRVLVRQNGAIADIPFSEIELARTEALVGGARLEIHRKNKPTVHVPYSMTQAQKFSETTRGIEQLRKEQEFFINANLDRTICESCGRLLPEKNGICPACLNKFATLGRIASYLKPYKIRAIVLALASIVTTVAELIPPYVTKLIVDDVLVLPEGTEVQYDERLSLLGWLVLALVGIRLITWGGRMGARLDSYVAFRTGDGGYPQPALQAPGIAIPAILRQTASWRGDVSRDDGQQSFTDVFGRWIALSGDRGDDVAGNSRRAVYDELVTGYSGADSRSVNHDLGICVLSADAEIFYQLDAVVV